MEWADVMVWRAVIASPDAAQDQKLRDYFHHLHLVQHAWLRAWQSETPDLSFPTLADLRSVMLWGRSYYAEIFGHLEQISDERLTATMRLPWAEMVEQQIGRQPDRVSIGETMLQIPLHSLYHRGQINARLRAVGGAPPTVDYIVWVWLARPAANWDFVDEQS